jgi:hypothetical protein
MDQENVTYIFNMLDTLGLIPSTYKNYVMYLKIQEKKRGKK